MDQSITSNKNPPVNGSNSKKCTKKLSKKLHSLFIFIFGHHHTTSRRRFWYTLIIFFICSYFMCIANVITELRWTNQVKVILPDFGFSFSTNYTPSLTKWTSYPDSAVVASIVFTLLWLFFDGPRKQKISILRRFLLISSLLYFGRGLCLIGTQLPPSFHFDNDDTFYLYDWYGTNIFKDAFLVLLRIKATDTDVFYSGHTVDMTLCALAIETYSNRKYLYYIFWIYTIFSLYVIIATKFHYSIDVIIAFALTVLTWKFYHMTMKIDEMRNNLPIFKYFESDREIFIYSASNTPIPPQQRSQQPRLEREMNPTNSNSSNLTATTYSMTNKCIEISVDEQEFPTPLSASVGLP